MKKSLFSLIAVAAVASLGACAVVSTPNDPVASYCAAATKSQVKFWNDTGVKTTPAGIESFTWACVQNNKPTGGSDNN